MRRIIESLRNQDIGTLIAEVIVVVVGIFIGLQVDDWNEGRKDRAEVRGYLERINQDLERDVVFFTFLTGEARSKRQALARLSRIVGADSAGGQDRDALFELLSESINIGFEFPEVQTVTFFDLQSSGKLALIADAGFRRQLSYYYQESLHRSDRIEAQITGYASTVYEMVGPGARLIGRDKSSGGDPTASAGELVDETFDAEAALQGFLLAARQERFPEPLRGEQNYTEFMLQQLNAQMQQISALQQAVSAAIGNGEE